VWPDRWPDTRWWPLPSNKINYFRYLVTFNEDDILSFFVRYLDIHWDSCVKFIVILRLIWQCKSVTLVSRLKISQFPTNIFFPHNCSLFLRFLLNLPSFFLFQTCNFPFNPHILFFSCSTSQSTTHFISLSLVLFLLVLSIYLFHLPSFYLFSLIKNLL
jgi:hypothetical protein